MGKLGERTECPVCAEEMLVLGIERAPNGDPLRKRWKCENPKCGHETEESFPTRNAEFKGGEQFPTRSKKPTEDSDGGPA